MILRGITIYTMVWYTMVYHDIRWQTVVDHAFSYIVYDNCMVYHGLPD